MRFSKLILSLSLALLITSPAFADLVLRQSTASQAVKVGPAVSSTDGNTEQTGLTIANSDVLLSKNGGTMAAKNSGGCTHDANGMYTCTLDATDTNTVGRLQMFIHTSGALPIYQEFNVVEEAVYDAYYGVSAPGYVANAPVDVAQFGGTALAPGSCTGAIPALGIIDCGTAQAVTGTTLQLRSAANFDANDEIVGATCVITSATTGAGQSRTISAYTNSTDTATVDTWTTTPTGTVTYACFGTASSTGGSGLDAAGVRSAIGLASANLDTQLSGLSSGISGLSSAIAVIDGIVDQLLIGVNVEQMNGHDVCGSGTSGDKWTGCP